MKISNSVQRILIFLLICYVFFILGRAVYSNWMLGREMDNLKAEIEKQKVENKNLENLLLYYKSDSFREVEARKMLGLKKPGETVVAVAPTKKEDYSTITETQKQSIAPQNSKNESNWILWWHYFTDGSQ